VREAARDHKRFRSGRPFISMPDLGQSVPIGLNPPEHALYRRMLNKYFIPDRMQELEPMVRGYVDEHLDDLLARGAVDIVPGLTKPLPARVLCALLHLPDEAADILLGHGSTLEAMRREDPAKVNAIIFELFAQHVREFVAQRRANPLDPETDLFSGVLAVEIDGQRLPDEVVVAIGVQIIAAGHGTTTDGLTGSIYRIATNPDIQARLRREPELIPAAIEEFLRLEVPIPEIGRTAAQDIELHGRAIPSGCPVGLNYAAANRDREEFPHAEACIIDREPNRHLTFGHGVHKCVGAPLARLQLRVALERLLARTSEIEVAGRPEDAVVPFLGSITSLPVWLAPSPA
jgi:cytochrome P450